ncbi:1-(5-phosphoribosyl)-5-[(5-phosphoribosylamino)methylideneamino]imidazole-4-carboxamide isomerase [Fulvivirgaceae bacterium BMA10]|uniref:1-(5-phosphoribosyl)-5-[(5-phosphoribosylamino)methylideneamino] imidazole-4-carboxamide isomerase n=1 Tax=Splendidivirga corallicola TaxID=3051826 RepID=A0ABT8KLX2_9BACT|nr:1-(5-phosphoribosyl)-5-[(5-phosphoribosylamino)methylideneamino]imidazole-4-carboxamide isomerase [Fulvivirgaceae bacterium BMA10]
MIEIIPAIDIIDGKCVRLTQGDYDQKKIYNENPLEVAKSFEGAGLKRLHMVDLDGARSKHIVNYKVLETVASNTSLKIDFGGGVKTDDDIKIAFDSGAQQVTGGSIAVKDKPTFKSWLKQYGPEKIILGADVKGDKIAISGWEEEATETLFDFLDEYEKEHIKYAICTDIAKDGLLSGTSIDLYQKIQQKYPTLKLIASGGVTTVKEIEKLNELNTFGVIIGKALYEGKIKLSELTKFLI